MNRFSVPLVKIVTLLCCLTVLFSAGAAYASEPLNGTEKAPILRGEGDTVFSLIVTDAEKHETFYEIRTNEESVGAALAACGLIEGEEGPYGLYIKSVAGVVADYSVTGTYWAFYINGEYAMASADLTVIETGAVYGLRIE